MGRPSKGILGKRRLPTADLDQNNQTQTSSGSRENLKPNKRVRFADIEDIPISHVRTPIHHLVFQFQSSSFIQLTLYPHRIQDWILMNSCSQHPIFPPNAQEIQRQLPLLQFSDALYPALLLLDDKQL